MKHSSDFRTPLLLFCALILLGAPATLSAASPNTDPLITSASVALDNASHFTDWLTSHKENFAGCIPKLDGKDYELCDGTRVAVIELQELFKKSPADLITFIKSQGINTEILCKDSSRATFQMWCKTNINRSFFKEVTSLHGQYIPRENTIVLHSDAYVGSMIHEYLHYLQYKNSNKKYDHVYKAERVKIQNDLIDAMDAIIAHVQKLEASGKKTELKSYLQPVMNLGNAMLRFSFWQRLIDERNLFQLYIRFHSQLGIAADDVALAKKNMGFICKDSATRQIIPAEECRDQ